jgi:hypothetical protein
LAYISGADPRLYRMQSERNLADRIDMDPHFLGDAFGAILAVEGESPFDLRDIPLQQHTKGPADPA